MPETADFVGHAIREQSMKDNAQTLRDYAMLVARGEAWTPMQKRESVSDVEKAFRLKMENARITFLPGARLSGIPCC